MLMVITAGKQETDFNPSPFIDMDAFASRTDYPGALWMSRRSVL